MRFHFLVGLGWIRLDSLSSSCAGPPASAGLRRGKPEDGADLRGVRGSSRVGDLPSPKSYDEASRRSCDFAVLSLVHNFKGLTYSDLV